MRKLLLTFLLMLFSSNILFAQRDTDHWFAPYFDSQNSTPYTHTLYFSTDSVAPFEVKIFNNNTQIGAVTISKNNPQSFPILQAQFIWTNNDSMASTIVNMGVYTKGTNP